MKLVCIPAYNEEKTIGEIVEKSLQYADKVIVCNDGSTDKTVERAKEKGAVIINHKKNAGYGAAIITLFEEARNQNAEKEFIDGIQWLISNGIIKVVET